VFPAQGREVLFEAGIGLGRGGSFEVCIVPQDDGGGDEVEAGSPVALVLEGAVAYLALAVDEHGLGEGVAGFSLVQPGGDAASCRWSRWNTSESASSLVSLCHEDRPTLPSHAAIALVARPALEPTRAATTTTRRWTRPTLSPRRARSIIQTSI
jgi:hypothetical protein